MPNERPKIFIGSSVESIGIAYAVQENLEHDALCSVWNQGIFGLSQSTFDNLMGSLDRFHFAIFVFQPDDLTRIHDETQKTVRDNVIFEFGLFLGRLGKERVFFLVPRGTEEMHLPSDLSGIQPGHYNVPENEQDLPAAVGPFCNQVRRKLSAAVETDKHATAFGGRQDECQPSVSATSRRDAEEQVIATPATRVIETGVAADEFENTLISLTPTIFFSNRIQSAFPGIRGLHWFDDPKEAVKRLVLLLKNPLRFDEATAHGAVTDPVWWFRGHESMFVEEFEALGETRCLLNQTELEISKVAVFHSNAYYQSFVYVEVRPDQPIGVYDYTEDQIQERVPATGYVYEEYALYDGIPVSRACYDERMSRLSWRID